MKPETILITGASRGIGAATVRRFARPGRRLVLLARSERHLERRVAEAEAQGAEARAISVDLASPESSRRAFDVIAEEEGPVEGLVLNAGVAADRRFREATASSMQREIEVNYLAPAELMRRLLPDMTRRRRGRVVVVGSLTSFVPFPGNASYSASKSAMLALVRSVRVELRGSGVHLGVVLPGYTRTGMTEGRSSYLPAMSAEEVADAVALCYERRRRLVVPGALNRAAARVFSMFPETSDRVLTQLARFVIPTPT